MKVVHRFEDGSHETFLRNYWYPILPSASLGSEPKAIRRLGEDLVIWRDGSGDPHLFPDACPHRRARLSLGRVRDDVIECLYHGWQYDGTGQCQVIPSEVGDRSVARSVKSWSYPTEERHGLIWAFMALDVSVEVPPLKVPEHLADPEWTGSIEEYPWEVPWRLAIDNVVDLMHVAYLHGETLPESMFPTEGVMRAVLLDDGVRSERVVNGVGQPDALTFHLPCLIELDFPFPPAGDVHCCQFLVPVDARNLVNYTLYMVRTPDEPSREEWMKHWDEWGRAAQQQVYVEDSKIIASQGDPEDVWRDERPAQLDAGIMRLRRLVDQELEKQRKGSNLVSS